MLRHNAGARKVNVWVKGHSSVGLVFCIFWFYQHLQNKTKWPPAPTHQSPTNRAFCPHSHKVCHSFPFREKPTRPTSAAEFPECNTFLLHWYKWRRQWLCSQAPGCCGTLGWNSSTHQKHNNRSRSMTSLLQQSQSNSVSGSWAFPSLNESRFLTRNCLPPSVCDQDVGQLFWSETRLDSAAQITLSPLGCVCSVGPCCWGNLNKLPDEI